MRGIVPRRERAGHHPPPGLPGLTHSFQSSIQLGGGTASPGPYLVLPYLFLSDGHAMPESVNSNSAVLVGLVKFMRSTSAAGKPAARGVVAGERTARRPRARAPAHRGAPTVEERVGDEAARVDREVRVRGRADDGVAVAQLAHREGVAAQLVRHERLDVAAVVLVVAAGGEAQGKRARVQTATPVRPAGGMAPRRCPCRAYLVRP